MTTNFSDTGYVVTRVAGQGGSVPVTLVYTVVKRKDAFVMLSMIHQTHPHAFLYIEDVRSTQKGIFPMQTHTSSGTFLGRKSK